VKRFPLRPAMDEGLLQTLDDPHVARGTAAEFFTVGAPLPAVRAEHKRDSRTHVPTLHHPDGIFYKRYLLVDGWLTARWLTFGHGWS
jgi:hypothetical protein